MKRIVVGADGSPSSNEAMRWAAHLASRHGAEIVVMTGFDPPNADLVAHSVEDLLSAQRSTIESWSEAARLGDVRVRSVIEPGDPRSGILTVAEREDADLIVVGRVGQSRGPGLFHLGSLAEWLAHHALRPIAVVGDTVEVPMERVLVGVDGSSGSRMALRWVRDLAAVSDLRIVLASVDQPYLEWTRSDSPRNWRRSLEQTIRDDFAEELTSAGVSFDVLALRGSNAADALLRAAKAERADLLVVGARGLGGLSALRIGGVALKTLHRTDRPVVVIPEREP